MVGPIQPGFKAVCWESYFNISADSLYVWKEKKKSKILWFANGKYNRKKKKKKFSNNSNFSDFCSTASHDDHPPM